MAGTGRIYVTAVREVGDIKATHQYDVDVRFDIAFDWGGMNLDGAGYNIRCDGQERSGTATFNIPSGSGSWVWGNIGDTKTFRITMPTSGQSKKIGLSGWIGTGVNPPNINASGEHTLSAVTWLYTVKFDANEGNSPPDNQTKTYGKDLTLSGVKPTREGYTFQSWNTQPDGKGTSYSAGGVYKANSGVTLYAIWVLNTYTITFNASANGGTGNTTKTVSHGKSLDSLPNASKPYYKFLGWFTKQSGGEKITTSTVFTSSITVYAQFELETTMAVFANGKWNPAMPYSSVNGEERQGYAHIVVNGEWHQGYGGT